MDQIAAFIRINNKMNPEFTVHVSNISPKANTKTVSDFFSFCGRIVNLYLKTDPSGASQQAIVVFESDSAAKTALLLTNALIVDKVIQVVPFTPALENEFQQQISSNPTQDQQPNQFTSQSEEDIVNREHSVPDSERTKTSVIASVIAAGYSVGQDAVIKARQVDEEHMISLNIKVGAEAVKAKANEIDNKLHITENATAVKNVVVEKAQQIDEKFQITGMFKSAGDYLSQQVNSLYSTVQENPTISMGINKVSTFGTYIKQEVQQVQDETSRAIDEKNREKGIPVVDSSNQNISQPEQELQQQQQQQQQQHNYSEM
ncbi:hypothetical protein DICPUDRAFT_156413 [Dictyostelium purpureum]|uniref:RRM domain-containing protein n=1 Tax=Dictyostelium purpureum TaxID=5786 RepID=F0ZWI3_DICPU|nr:uncharacterized protein DICPUDRAFT_156413 [Dictyostelium purpureum]EGC31706.1 hypothetical protein DICPUDRAFT_156413 [Dictyostelium purpureum]|eukprot:XP_003291772.1 hypothetical protein DICPUDRAFT_156413 [Dictyostelium purpureum]